jgi:hypothetical protein
VSSRADASIAPTGRILATVLVTKVMAYPSENAMKAANKKPTKNRM